jgi:thiamine biosynthesis protein ThiS
MNGQEKEFPALDENSALSHLVTLLEMKADRIAIERNGEIVPRAAWERVLLQSGDKLEIVQFVGGGK